MVDLNQNKTESIAPSFGSYQKTDKYGKSSTAENIVFWVGLGLGLSIFVLVIFLFYRYRNRNQGVVAAPTPQDNTPELEIIQQDRQVLVESLPVRSFPGERQQLGDVCPICLEEFVPGQTYKFLPLCGHSFYLDCITDAWVRHRMRLDCPLCHCDYSTWQPADASASV